MLFDQNSDLPRRQHDKIHLYFQDYKKAFALLTALLLGFREIDNQSCVETEKVIVNLSLNFFLYLNLLWIVQDCRVGVVKRVECIIPDNVISTFQSGVTDRI